MQSIGTKLGGGSGPGPGPGPEPDPNLLFSLEPDVRAPTPSYPGFRYAWDGVSQFKGYDMSLGLTALIGDKSRTPFKDVAGIRVYPFYPKWVKGESAAIGDLRWIYHRETERPKIVRFNAAVPSLPEAWEYDTVDLDIRDDYQDDLGHVYGGVQSQLLESPTDLSHADWTALGGGTKSVEAYPSQELIEGFTNYARITATTQFEGAVSTIGNFPSSLRTVRIIARPVSGTSFGWDINGNWYFYWDHTTHSIIDEREVNVIEAVKWLPGGWIDITCKLSSAGGSSSMPVSVYASARAEPGEIELAYIGIVDSDGRTQDFCEPIPTKSTQPFSKEIQFSTDYAADWVGNGCDEEHTIMSGVDVPRLREGGQGIYQGVFITWTNEGGNTPDARRAAFQNINANSSQSFTHLYQNATYQTTNYSKLKVKGLQYVSTGGTTRQDYNAWVSEAGDVAGTIVDSTGYTGTIEPGRTPHGIFCGSLPGFYEQRAAHCVHRFFGLWNKFDAVDWDAIFGPSNYSGQ